MYDIIFFNIHIHYVIENTWLLKIFNFLGRLSHISHFLFICISICIEYISRILYKITFIRGRGGGIDSIIVAGTLTTPSLLHHSFSVPVCSDCLQGSVSRVTAVHSHPSSSYYIMSSCVVDRVDGSGDDVPRCITDVDVIWSSPSSLLLSVSSLFFTPVQYDNMIIIPDICINIMTVCFTSTTRTTSADTFT